MTRRRAPRSAAGAILALIAAVIGYYTYQKSTPGAPAPVQTAGIRVVKIVDGDTVELSDGQRVRYLGIDTPEKKEPLYAEAAKLNERLVLNREVRWELGKEPKDDYGRTLVWLFADGKLVNVEMVREGLARVYLFPSNDQYKEALIAAQKEARAAKRGRWAEPHPADEKFYVSGRGGSAQYRFHRPSCKLIKDLDKKIHIETPDQALDEGRSPCRECKP
jgi:micrococcal nuclease